MDCCAEDWRSRVEALKARLVKHLGTPKTASVTLDIEKGDTLLGGRFKNMKTVVKDLGTDDLGQPTVNGKKLLSFRIAKLMPKAAADKGWLGALPPKSVVARIKAIHKHIDRKDLAADGIETDPHVTLAYGLAEKINPFRVKAQVTNSLPLEITLGPLTAFKNPDATVLKFDVSSWDMKQLNKRIKDKLKLPGNTHKEFKPHLTVAYLKPGTDISKYKKLEKGLKGKTFLSRNVDYSNGNTEMELKTAHHQGFMAALSEIFTA